MATFGEAIEEMKKGQTVARSGWNGKGMYVYLAQLTEHVEPCFIMYTAQGKLQPGWLASQMDMLADDWEVYIPF